MERPGRAAPLRKTEQPQSPPGRYCGCVKSKPIVNRATAAPITADFQAGSKRRKNAAFGAEQTKPSDVRSIIRATEGKRWTARQQGRG
jgi:hypothetical protein